VPTLAAFFIKKRTGAFFVVTLVVSGVTAISHEKRIHWSLLRNAANVSGAWSTNHMLAVEEKRSFSILCKACILATRQQLVSTVISV